VDPDVHDETVVACVHAQKVRAVATITPDLLALANGTHVKNAPDRKTDVKDAAWLADLLAHGRASFVPPVAAGHARGFTRLSNIRTAIILIDGKLDLGALNPHARQPARFQ
jgi:hypothetical protein